MFVDFLATKEGFVGVNVPDHGPRVDTRLAERLHLSAEVARGAPFGGTWLRNRSEIRIRPVTGLSTHLGSAERIRGGIPWHLLSEE